MGTDEDRERVKSLLRKEKSGWRKERLIALKMGFNPQNTLEQISESIGRSVPSIQRWFSTYRKEGIDALLKRAYPGAQPRVCNEEIMAFIKQGVRVSRWNTATQAQEQLHKHFNKRFKYHTVYSWLKKVAGVLRIPRPVHEKRDPLKAERFKRSFYGKLKALTIAPDKPVKVWFADESRYGLLPNLRRVWTFKGVRPHKPWQSKYEWSYCYGAIDVVDGHSVFIQTPTVSMKWTQAFLEQIKKEYPGYEHVVVWDGAGFHADDSSHEMIPDGIHIITLPAYSPELNPIEKLWDLIQDHTSNKLWPSIERLDQVVAKHLKDWWENPQRVISLVGKGWIRASANDSSNYDFINL